MASPSDMLAARLLASALDSLKIKLPVVGMHFEYSSAAAAVEKQASPYMP